MVPLKKLRVVLDPHQLLPGDDVALASSEFQLYHRAVLRRSGPALDPSDAAIVIANATELGVEPGQLILAALLAHRTGGADRPFYAKMLIGPSAMKHLTRYRDECATKYGTFDAGVLGDVAELPREHNIVARLRASEELAAAWAIKAALRGKDFYTLYDSREMSLDPWWLASEPSYFVWLAEHGAEANSDFYTSEDAESGKARILALHELHRHRQRARLAGGRAGFRAVVHAREEIVRSVAISMTSRMNLHLDLDLVLVAPTFSEPLRLWNALADAYATQQAMNFLTYQ